MEFEVDVFRRDLERLKELGKKDREEILLAAVVNKKGSKIVEALLNLGTNVDTMNGDRDTALVLACDKDNVESIRLLVESGANVNYTESSIGTPLYLACQNENKAIVRYLVDRGVKINDASNYNRETALMQACRNLSKDIVKFLIQEGANVNVSNVYGVTPISLMCRCVGRDYDGAFRIAKLLIRSGADLNVLEKDGVTTPLLIASRYKNAKLVALLVENGAVVKSSYNDEIKRFIKHTVDNMYPSLVERREIKEALEARDIHNLEACLYDYLGIESLNDEDYSKEEIKKIHKIKNYIYSLKDGEEFRKVVREIRELRHLIGRSSHDMYLSNRVDELNSKLKVDMNIFNLINKMQLKIENLENEKCWGRNRMKVKIGFVDKNNSEKGTKALL